MPYANPADRKAYEQLRAEARRKSGLCANCNAQAVQGETRCQACKDNRRRQ